MHRSPATGPPTASACITQGHMLLLRLQERLTGKLHTEELQLHLIFYLSDWFSKRRISPPTSSVCICTVQRSNVCHKVKHRQATWRFVMRLLCSFHAQYLSFFLFFPAGLWSFPLSFNRERSSYHQSAFSSCGLRQCHAGLCVLPDRTTVPSGYPYTSSLTPLIFTRYRENWKIHGSLKWAHRSQTFEPCFLSGLGAKEAVSVNH